MKKYRILCSQITYFAINIEAENEDQALEISNNLDVDEFSELPFQDWQLDDICLSDNNHLDDFPLITKNEVTL